MNLTTFKVNDSTHVQMLIVQKIQKKFTNLFKYKCETLSCYMCFKIY
jgi:hypothetical protein